MTSYDVIYNVFFDKCRDYSIFELSEETSNEVLYGYLKGSIKLFNRVCVQDLSDRDEDDETFNFDLSDDEIDILAEGMCQMFIKANLNNSDLFKNGLSSKDYTLFSPANLLNAIQNTYDRCQKEVRSLMNEYSFENGDIRDWKKNAKR